MTTTHRPEKWEVSRRLTTSLVFLPFIKATNEAMNTLYHVVFFTSNDPTSGNGMLLFLIRHQAVVLVKTGFPVPGEGRTGLH